VEEPYSEIAIIQKTGLYLLVARNNVIETDDFLSVAANESAFDPRAKGGVGELGLMQLRPETAAWIARRDQLPWKGKKSLLDVKLNITYGIHYLGYLKSHTRVTSRYLAAYNMGLKALVRKLKRSEAPKEYAQKTQKFYRNLRANYLAFLVKELSSPAKRDPAITGSEGEAVADPQG
jgi:soluble lytic murein transglycosylase-like protein